jgi:hypothetical protein
MARVLSAAVLSALMAQDTSEGFVILLTIDHADLAQPIRVCSNQTDLTSNGDVYQAFPFQVNLPSESDDAPPQVTLSIDNVDRQIVTAVRTISSPPTVDMSVVMLSDPDTVEVGPFTFTLNGVEYDRLTVSGQLGFEQILSQPWPEGTFNPTGFPGLFA